MAVLHNERRRAAEHPVAEGQPAAVAGPGRRWLAVGDQSERVQQLGANRERPAGARGQLHVPGRQPRGHGRAHGRSHRAR